MFVRCKKKKINKKDKQGVCESTINQPLLLFLGKDYSGTKFFYTQPLFLNKAHSTK